MPEFGQFPFTESARYGTTVNPWDPTRSPGGSSGGSAAAVAAGLVPLALGGDGGGSIRIPASCCGLFGLKPRRGRVSAAPHPDLWGSLGTAGVLSRTVADSALAYDAIAGVTPFDRWRAPALGRSFAEAAATEPGRMRIGWTTRPAVAGIPVDTQVAAAVRRTAVRLEDLGHQVDELDRPLPSQVAAFIPQLYAALREEAGRVEHPDRLEALTRAGIRLGALVTPGVLARALRAAGSLTERVDGLLASYDVLLTPTLACLPPPLGRLDGVGHTVATLRATPMAAFTSLFNVTGHPAASVPAGLSREGWPIGVQLAAANEDTIMSLAAQLETDQPWPSPA